MDLNDVTCHGRVFSKTSCLKDQERSRAKIYSFLLQVMFLKHFQLEGLGEEQLTSSKNV